MRPRVESGMTPEGTLLKKFFENKIGFTLVELLIVLGILSVVAVLAVPFYQSTVVNSDFDIAADNIKKTLRRAETNAATGFQDDSWGVFFMGNSFTLYKGESFAARDTDFDEAVGVNAIFVLSNDFNDEINFEKYTGTPSANGTVTITSPNNETLLITVDAIGRVDISEP
ncbi:MAG: hypothetical protein COT81_01705 [Candidatus Buchananbacteria bacterium CG10_big_fil_rev_8_21_14_0_10_42_9]|uniref:General secretion pathway GspH domain-containing protein n=1 Tax=Candidatus Buchananbacteria bacterium CG10_big_fil_rev_8_21_14_0_10_42_9 TaxID=1974526 RepID=A0A2H0W1V6_9BACT|nr:MAG: hypothetical protein COT81_01705 [Candidatus Buchananbacteria bacterium CG10_big_fil_rev_8_21_14_0_10_42_9]